jgi:cyanate permease
MRKADQRFKCGGKPLLKIDAGHYRHAASYCASASAIQNFGGYLGATLSPIATGYVLDVTGSFVVALSIGAAFTGFATAVFPFGVCKRILPQGLDPTLALTRARV